MKTRIDNKNVKSHNKSGKPDNIVEKENDIYMECEKIQKGLPSFLRSYFSYLKGNVLPMTRLAYLHDVLLHGPHASAGPRTCHCRRRCRPDG